MPKLSDRVFIRKLELIQILAKHEVGVLEKQGDVRLASRLLRLRETPQNVKTLLLTFRHSEERAQAETCYFFILRVDKENEFWIFSQPTPKSSDKNLASPQWNNISGNQQKKAYPF